MQRYTARVTANHAYLAALGATWGLISINIIATPLLSALHLNRLSPSLLLGVNAVLSEAGLTIPLILVIWLARLEISNALGLRGCHLSVVFWSILSIAGAGIILDELMYLAVSFAPSLRTGGLDGVGMAIANASVVESFLLLVPLALLPSLCEEALCRGVVLRGLFSRFATKPWIAIVLSSLFFGMLHLDRLHAPVAALMGLLFGLITLRAGSLCPAIICHFVNNTVSIMTPAVGGPSLTQVLDRGHAPWIVGAGIIVLGGGMYGLLRSTRPVHGSNHENRHCSADADHGQQK